MTGRIPTVACTALVSLVLAGCGSGDGGKTSDDEIVVQGVRVLRIIDVHETDFALEPTLIRIDRFGYYGIRAINDGAVTHSLALDGHGLDKETRSLAPGESATLLAFFREAGAYTLYCPVDGHEQQGMKATVKVH